LPSKEAGEVVPDRHCHERHPRADRSCVAIGTSGARVAHDTIEPRAASRLWAARRVPSPCLSKTRWSRSTRGPQLARGRCYRDDARPRTLASTQHLRSRPSHAVRERLLARPWPSANRAVGDSLLGKFSSSSTPARSPRAPARCHPLPSVPWPDPARGKVRVS
jgi:hypothetical protein